MLEINNLKIEWLGHASLRIKNSLTIYIDPFNITSAEPADLILITHGHYDHCSISDIRKIIRPATTLILPPDCSSKVSKLESAKLQLITPNQRIKIGEVTIEAVSAYNMDKQFHPKINDWLGYIVDINKTRIYHAGDTDFIPEMKSIKADIAFLPVGGTYTMTAEEAAKAANTIKPKIAVPMHYGQIVGTAADAERFKKLCKCPVEIM
ncbi:MAG: MBL fold metallo-hydrolase [Candidatus Woesearchaeota archaeon]